MRKLRTFSVLAVITVAAVGAAVWSQREASPPVPHEGLLLPALQDKVNDVATVAVKTKNGDVTIVRKDGHWVVPQRHDYPAQVEEVRKLLIGAAELRRVEAKTSKPELFAKLDLGDPGKDSESVGYTLKGADGATIAALVVGKRQYLTGSADIDRYFVRVPGEKQAWLVEGQIPKHFFVTDWLASEVVHIAPERVHRTVVHHADGTVVEVVKAKPGDPDFTLLGIPPGKEVKSSFTVHSLATTPADLSLSDVLPLDEVSFDKPDLQVTTETFDGLRIHLDVAKKGEDDYLRLHAEQDRDLPGRLGVKVEASGSKETSGAHAAGGSAEHPAAAGGEAKAGSAAGRNAEGNTSSGKSAGPQSKLEPPDKVAAEVKAMNARWSKWAYKVPSYHIDTLRKKVEDLVKAPENKDKNKGEAGTSSSG